MKESFAHPGFRLAFQQKNIHTAAMILCVADWDAGRGRQRCQGRSGGRRQERTHSRVTFARQGSAHIQNGTRASAGRRQRAGGRSQDPEGHYILDGRNAKSRYYKSIHLSYPSEQDKQRAAQRGVSAGGDIMIHGLPNGFGWLGATHRARDWTDGCVAVTDAEMNEIWELVPDGTPIEIRP